MSAPRALSGVPRGIGVYLTRSAYARADDLPMRAAKAASARARWVVLCVAGDDGWQADLDDVRRVGDAYREHGIDPHVWALDSRQDAAHPDRCASRLLDALHACDGAGVVGDIEAAYKGRVGVVRQYLGHLIDGLTERHSLGVTSYPVARYHPDLPWGEMAVGWGGPQLYKTAERPELARVALEEWTARHGVVVPHLAAFDVSGSATGQAEQLRRHLRLVPEDAPAIAVWADASLDREERAVLAAWSDARGW